MTTQDVLLVDDESEALISLSRALKASGLTARVHAASEPKKAIQVLSETNAQVAVIDLSLDKREGVESGFRLIREILAQSSTCRVIVLTGHGSVTHGVRALALGAANFLEKPADAAHLTALINDGITQSMLRRDFQRLNSESPDSSINSLIIGKSEIAKAVRKEALYAAQNNLPILLTGETGTGKGLCALAIHKSSLRASSAFVRYQPTFSTSDLVNSELFGHKKGSFTGANEDRKGLILQAQNGTLFLDEIEELPIETQVALLGVLQDKKLRMVGSNDEQAVDFRLICAGNQDLKQSLDSGKLRGDFFHRIGHIVIDLKPLRARKEDISELAEHFLGRVRERENISVLAIEDNAVNELMRFDWPGNIRQLEAVIEGAAFRASFEGRVSIVPSDLRLSGGGAAPSSQEKIGFHEQVRSFKLKLIKDKLAETSGNQVKAARELGLDRATLRRLLE